MFVNDQKKKKLSEDKNSRQNTNVIALSLLSHKSVLPSSSSACRVLRELANGTCRDKPISKAFVYALVSNSSPHPLKPPRKEALARPQSFTAKTRKKFEKP